MTSSRVTRREAQRRKFTHCPKTKSAPERSCERLWKVECRSSIHYSCQKRQRRAAAETVLYAVTVRFLRRVAATPGRFSNSRRERQGERPHPDRECSPPCICRLYPGDRRTAGN